MKKLCANPKRVHPSPPPPHPPLSILPTALLALASALSAEDQEVLAYLLGAEKPLKDDNNKNKKQKQQLNKKKPSSSSSNNDNHPPHLGCSCFGCYKSFWARWDASPNRHVIHLIIDAFEEKEAAINLKKKLKGNSSSSSRKKRSSNKINGDDDVMVNTDQMKVADDHKLADDAHAHAHDDGDGDEDDEVEEEGKSSVSRFVSWVFGINN